MGKAPGNGREEALGSEPNATRAKDLVERPAGGPWITSRLERGAVPPLFKS